MSTTWICAGAVQKKSKGDGQIARAAHTQTACKSKAVLEVAQQTRWKTMRKSEKPNRNKTNYLTVCSGAWRQRKKQCLATANNKDCPDSAACRGVPPRLYGGTERCFITESWSAGPRRYVVASGDFPVTSAFDKLHPLALRLDPKFSIQSYYMLMLDRVRDCASDFDILHFHIDFSFISVFRAVAR